MRKKTLLILSLICFSIALYAQHNAIKGRLFYLPGDLKFFSMGIAYERMLTSRTAVQLMYNRYGHDTRSNDGNSVEVNALVAEYRVYLGKGKYQDRSSTTFLGAFSEFAKRQQIPAGFDVEGDPKKLLEENQRILSLGILIGRKMFVSNSWYVEIYTGLKHQFVDQESIYLEHQIEKIEQSDFSEWALRFGINLACSF